MTAWDILIANSTAPAASIAWVHLNSQSGGTIQIFGEMEVKLMSDLEVEIEGELESILAPELMAELEPELIAEVC